MKDKKKIIILVGVSGSGKSTYAKEVLKDNSYIRINRDSLRESLFISLKGYYTNKCLKDREDLVSYIENSLLDELEFSEFNCVVDNTNLSLELIQKYLEIAFCAYEGFDDDGTDYLDTVKIVIFDTPLEVCKEAVMKRDGLTIEQVVYIDNQYKRFKDLVEDIKQKELPYEIITRS